VYPGNLAADILGAAKAKPASVMDYADASLRRRSPWVKWVLGLGALAAAAMVAVVVYTHQVPTPKSIAMIDPTNRPDTNNDTEQVPLAPDATASINDVETQSITPSDMDSTVPTFQSMSFPSIPSFSDLSMTTDDSSDTTNTTNNSQNG
jgi:hypothetical protein